MRILQALLENNNGETVQLLAKNFGLEEQQIESILSSVVPAMTGNIKQNISSESGFQDLVNCFDGHHEEYVANPTKLAEPESINEGNAILGHVLGSKEQSRTLASKAATDTKQDVNIIKQMLPMVANTLMGTLSQETSRSGLLGGMQQGAANNQLLGVVTNLLDSDKDGSVWDDLFGMARKIWGQAGKQ